MNGRMLSRKGSALSSVQRQRNGAEEAPMTFAPFDGVTVTTLCDPRRPILSLVPPRPLLSFS